MITNSKIIDTLKRVRAFEKHNLEPEQQDIDVVHQWLAQDPEADYPKAREIAAQYAPSAPPKKPRAKRTRPPASSGAQSPQERAREIARARQNGAFSAASSGGLAGLEKARANARRLHRGDD